MWHILWSDAPVVSGGFAVTVWGQMPLFTELPRACLLGNHVAFIRKLVALGEVASSGLPGCFVSVGVTPLFLGRTAVRPKYLYRFLGCRDPLHPVGKVLL
jgi:hypothetical protein